MTAAPVRVYHTDDHVLHDPPYEYFDGIIQQKYLECPERITLILDQLRSSSIGFEFVQLSRLDAERIGQIIAVAERIHSKDYISFLQSAYSEWCHTRTLENDAQGQASRPPPLFGASYPPRHCTRSSKSILGKAGFYLKDLSCPIDQNTWNAVLASANLSLTAAEQIRQCGCRQIQFAMCRPPGHHSGRSFAAGYCYLNNAALAAEQLVHLSNGRAAILDIDYHAGNGTQDIFYERDDVFTISIHGDPDFDYPYYAGYEDECGQGQGQGYHRNFPLPAGTDDETYLSVLKEALHLVRNYEPNYLVVSAGMDIFTNDPLGTFNISTNGIRRIGELIGSSIPDVHILVCLEGGYCNDAIGLNIANLLEGMRTPSSSGFDQ